MTRGRHLTQDQKRERAEARKRASDKLSLEAKIEKATRNGHQDTKEVQRLKAALRAEKEKGEH